MYNIDYIYNIYIYNIYSGRTLGNNGTGPQYGGQGSSESEAKDRYDINLRGVQQELFEAVVAANTNVVLVLLNAGCLAFDTSMARAIVESYYPGTYSLSHASTAADLLFVSLCTRRRAGWRGTR